jgi:hypothetical protein
LLIRGNWRADFHRPHSKHAAYRIRRLKGKDWEDRRKETNKGGMIGRKKETSTSQIFNWGHEV